MTDYEERLKRLEDCHENMRDEVSDLRDKNTGDTAEIKEGIKYIKLTLDRMDGCNTALKTCVDTLAVDLAKRPNAEEVKGVIKDVQTHKTYFLILGGVVTLVIILLAAVLPTLLS